MTQEILPTSDKQGHDFLYASAELSRPYGACMQL